MSTKFMVKINRGDPIEFVSRFSIYSYAVLEVFGKLDCDYPCDIEIWSPSVVSEYGPYRYRIDDFIDVHGVRYGCPSIMPVN